MIRASIFIAGLALPSAIYAGPIVMGKRISSEIVCPAADTSKCVQAAGNTVPIYIRRPQRFLPLDGSGNPLLWRYFGREMTDDASQQVNFCGNVFSNNPLETYAANHPEAAVIDPPYVGSSFTFNRKAKSIVDAGFKLDIDAALKAANIPTSNGRAKAEASLEAAFNRVKSSNLTLKGQYVFITIAPSLVASLHAIDTPDELKNCANYIKSNNSSIITGLTGVKIETLTTSGSIVSKATADFDVKLKDVLTSEQISSLRAALSNELEQSWSTAFKPTFQVLSISGYRGTIN